MTTDETTETAILFQNPYELVDIFGWISKMNDGDEGEENMVRLMVEVQCKIRELIVEGRIVMYRAITVDENWLKTLKPGSALGAHWSYFKRGARAYRGDQNHPFTAIITVSVPIKDVNLFKSFDRFQYGVNEILPCDGATLTLVNIQMVEGGGTVIDQSARSDLYGKQFMPDSHLRFEYLAKPIRQR